MVDDVVGKEFDIKKCHLSHTLIIDRMCEGGRIRHRRGFEIASRIVRTGKNIEYEKTLATALYCLGKCCNPALPVDLIEQIIMHIVDDDDNDKNIFVDETYAHMPMLAHCDVQEMKRKLGGVMIGCNMQNWKTKVRDWRTRDVSKWLIFVFNPNFKDDIAVLLDLMRCSRSDNLNVIIIAQSVEVLGRSFRFMYDFDYVIHTQLSTVQPLPGRMYKFMSFVAEYRQLCIVIDQTDDKFAIKHYILYFPLSF